MAIWSNETVSTEQYSITVLSSGLEVILERTLPVDLHLFSMWVSDIDADQEPEVFLSLENETILVFEGNSTIERFAGEFYAMNTAGDGSKKVLLADIQFELDGSYLNITTLIANTTGGLSFQASDSKLYRVSPDWESILQHRSRRV